MYVLLSLFSVCSPHCPLDKAAQAAAQAAQAAAMQSQSGPQTLHNMTIPMPSSLQSDNMSVSAIPTAHLTQEQAIQILQKLSQQPYTEQPFSLSSSSTSNSMNGVSVGGYANSIARGAQGVSSAHALERMFVNPSPTTALYSEEQLRSAHLSSREDLVGAPSYNGYFDLQTFSAQQQEQQHQGQQVQPSTRQGSSVPRAHQPRSSQYLQFPRDVVAGAVPFSPFSPDPNATHVFQRNVFPDAHGREPYELPPHDEPIDTGASSETRYTSRSARSSNVSRYASFQGLVPRPGSGSTSTSPTNRTNIPVPISRPLSGQPTSTSGVDPFEMHDLNGTLASLNLGEASFSSVMDSRPWGVKSPAGSSDSSASVQFQMTKDDVTSG